MPSQLTQLVYYSKVNPDDRPDLEKLLEHARKNNQKQHLTGALWVYDDYYIQVLEGERTRVSKLYNRIALDPRHSDVVMVGCLDINERDFPEWWMGYLLATEKNRSSILKYSCSDMLEPVKMNHYRIVNLIKEISGC